MHELFTTVLTWYEAHLNYGTITLLMAIESSFIPLPSELVLPPAANMALKGQLDLSLIIVFSTIGCVIGALFNYVLSFYLGRKIIYALAETKWARVFFVTPAKVEHAENYFLANGNSSTFIGRLIPGVRHLISIPAGLAKMNLKKFILFTALGSLIWNATLTLMSYFLIDKWETYFKEFTWGIIIIGVLFIAYLVYKAYTKKQAKA